MAYPCIKGFGECDGCGYCSNWDEDENEAFRGEDYDEDEEDEDV